MELFIALAWLAAIGVVVFFALQKLWTGRVRAAKILGITAAVCLVIYFMGGEIGSMLLWYLELAFLLACPGLILAIVFRNRLKRRWAQFKAWWRRMGAPKAAGITFVTCFVIYLIGSGSAVILLLVLIVAYLFRNSLSGWWDGLKTLGRRAVRSP